MRLLDLADFLRKAGLTVMEADGWKERGVPFAAKPDTIVCHHTATSSRVAGDLPTLGVLIRGHSTLPGPLSQLGLSRTGVVHVLASGKANHAGRGRWMRQESSARTIGIEAEHPGGTTGWPREQYAAYVDLVAALCRYLDIPPAQVAGHKEWATPAGRKVDPNFDMTLFRQVVEARLAPPPAPPRMFQEEDSMTFVFNNQGTTYLRDGGDTIAIPHWDDALKFIAQGARDLTELSDDMTTALLEAAKQ